MTNARVLLWGSEIGAVSWLDDREIGVFQYYPDFIRSQIQVAPLTMPLDIRTYSFPNLPRNTFKGLPGLLADSLPDKYGTEIVNAWLENQGRSPSSFNSVERLCYVGERGMGALEFEPALLESPDKYDAIEVEQLAELASRILNRRQSIGGILTGDDDKKALEDIIRVGTSAGGARAKAILAWSPMSNEFKSGQVIVEPGFEYWILKFDGVESFRDSELGNPKGYGKIEYAYYLMAKDIGIEMMDCRIHEEGGRSHFMTKRFDRDDTGRKVHMQSLGAIAHFNFNKQGVHSYEQAINVIKRLNLPRTDLIQLVYRAMFNIIGRNQDDHVKNIAFLMDRRGNWRLSPAFDMSYAFNESGLWTNKHQMSLNNKRDKFERKDLIDFAGYADIKSKKANEMLDSVIDIFSRWSVFAEKSKMDEESADTIQANLRTKIR